MNLKVYTIDDIAEDTVESRLCTNIIGTSQFVLDIETNVRSGEVYYVVKENGHQLHRWSTLESGVDRFNHACSKAIG